MNITTKQKQYLKGLAHNLKPVVMIGNNGLTQGVMAEIDQSLEIHELIKVKIAGSDKETTKLIIETILDQTNSICAQHIGHVIVLYRQSKQAIISLPKA